ncbi:MAG: YqaA family protein [Calditrichota bacterium]
MEWLIEYGLLGLFLSAFLSATLLPLNSEIVLAWTLCNGFGWMEVVALATLGNVMGSLVNYWLGLRGGPVLSKNLSGTSRKHLSAARLKLARYGPAALLFSWVPLIGDPLTLLAGFLRINFALFCCYVFLGKFMRYLLLAGRIMAI